MKSKSTPSYLDPFSTSLLNDCPGVLIEPITSIINKSLQEGVFPDQLKKTYIRPLLKKTILDKNELKKYRPISNLSLILKILEKWSHLAYFPTWKQIQSLIFCDQHTRNFTPLNQLF